MDNKTLSAGVDLTLGERRFTLVPTLKAAQAVSHRFNGFVGATQAVASFEFNAIAFIIRQGVPAKEIKDSDLELAVFEAGLASLFDPILSFLRRLQNGGRDPAPNDEDAADSEEGASDPLHV